MVLQRRLRLGSRLVVLLALTACGAGAPLIPSVTASPPTRPSTPGPNLGPEDGRLSANPGQPTLEPPPPGTLTLPVGGGAKAPLLRVPSGLDVSESVPLVVMAHGANGRPSGSIHRLDDIVGNRALILAPGSEEASWDMIYGGLGPDVARLDAALNWTFRRFSIDTHRLAMAGFSDGGSWALTLGLINGDLFSHVIAYSPGFVADGTAVGTPLVWISHGTEDTVLPPRTSEPIVRALRANGYPVWYVRFPGRHELPPEIAARGMRWFFSASST
jgi:phospholipase/carboxylesterase